MMSDEKFKKYQLEDAITRLREWIDVFGEEKAQAFVNDIVAILVALDDMKADYNRLHEATRCIIPLVETPFESPVDLDLYIEAVRLVEMGRK